MGGKLPKCSALKQQEPLLVQAEQNQGRAKIMLDVGHVHHLSHLHRTDPKSCQIQDVGDHCRANGVECRTIPSILRARWGTTPLQCGCARLVRSAVSWVLDWLPEST